MLTITTILLLSLSKLFRIKVIASERSYPKFYNYFTKILLRLFAGNARAWVFQTEQAKEWYGKSIKGVRYNIIPNAINKECIDLRIRDFNDHANVIVSAGRLKPLKNHELILRAYARLKDKYPEYKIIIYGEGSLKEYLRNLSVELDIDKNVELPGFEPNLPAKVQNAKLFIMSSNFEGMPNALLEAMSLGVVCISTDCAGGAARSIIENGSNGLIVPCNDVESLAEAIDLVLSDDEYCRKLVTNGIRIRDTHNSESIYKKWELLVEDIVNS
jgi:glycosyltransferase involved in cell wall biosynthesis